MRVICSRSRRTAGHPLHQLVAERGIGLGLAPQTGPVDGDGPDRVDGAGVEVPAVGGHEPAPAHGGTGPQCLDDDRSRSRRVHLDGDPAAAQQVERVGRVALGQEQVTGIEGHVLGASGHAGDGVARQARQKRMRGHQLGHGGRHDAVPVWAAPARTAPSLPAMAATSSVRSMPTGHHAMHRPHPTQPDVPNWSHHVESLWVSHWR